MHLAFIGLGRMGYNMVLNLRDHGHSVAGYDRSEEQRSHAAASGVSVVDSLDKLVAALPQTRQVIWLMIPAGKPVDATLMQLIPLLKKGAIIIDGGNSYFADSVKRAAMLRKRGISFLDCGTSGGIVGARHGACMMIGGDKAVFHVVEQVFRDLCVVDGYAYVGKSGAGHFVKMVHNGIEYGMMAALGEGMQALQQQSKKFAIPLTDVARVYAHGSIVDSKLASWLHDAMADEQYFNAIHGSVPQGETEHEMQRLEKLSSMPVLHQARLMRVASRKKPSFAGKVIAAMRNKFGGHAVVRAVSQKQKL